MEETEKDSGRDMTPKLIGETYMKYPTEKSSKKIKFGLYQCCYCGKSWECSSSLIKTGRTKSCGCQKINTLGIKHGLYNNRFYATWNNIFKRCTNPKNKYYKDYGGRGITVCEEWLDVTIFIAWCESTHPNMEGYTLDRIDNDKGYNPENCRWADRSTQSINQRIQKNNKSGVVGVHYYKGNVKWVAYISVTNTRKHIGYFDSIEEAVQARDQYILDNKLPNKLSTDYKLKEK